MEISSRSSRHGYRRGLETREQGMRTSMTDLRCRPAGGARATERRSAKLEFLSTWTTCATGLACRREGPFIAAPDRPKRATRATYLRYPHKNPSQIAKQQRVVTILTDEPAIRRRIRLSRLIPYPYGPSWTRPARTRNSSDETFAHFTHRRFVACPAASGCPICTRRTARAPLDGSDPLF